MSIALLVSGHLGLHRGPTRPLLLLVSLLPTASAGKRKKGAYFAYFSPAHGAAVFSSWHKCAKWSVGQVASNAYYAGGFSTAEEAAVAAAVAGGHGGFVNEWVPIIATDADPVHLASPGHGAHWTHLTAHSSSTSNSQAGCSQASHPQNAHAPDPAPAPPASGPHTATSAGRARGVKGGRSASTSVRAADARSALGYLARKSEGSEATKLRAT